MLFNEDYSLESVKVLVEWFLTKGYNCSKEFTIREIDNPHYQGSVYHEVMDRVFLQSCSLGIPHWYIHDVRNGSNEKHYVFYPARDTKSILWDCEIDCDNTSHNILVIAPTHNIAMLEASHQWMPHDGWGPRHIESAKPLSEVDLNSIPEWKKRVG